MMFKMNECFFCEKIECHKLKFHHLKIYKTENKIYMNERNRL
jgi:hypothetical protein